MAILLTGGAGYIGRHTCGEMLNAGYDVVVSDNLDNSNAESLNRVEKITGKKVRFYKEDVRDKEALNKVIWKVYYEKPYTDMIGRVLGQGVKTGIYKITNMEN